MKVDSNLLLSEDDAPNCLIIVKKLDQVMELNAPSPNSNMNFPARLNSSYE